MCARIYLLAGGAFAVGTSAYVVSGVLPAVSSELHVSLTAAGQLATAFALSYAVGAPLLSTLTGRWERRTLLIAALLLAAAGNLIAAVATTYPLLIAGRVVAALGAAAYTPAATLFATGFLPPHERGRAVAVVFGGLTFALVLGVPAGSLLGGSLGYRGVFALIAAVAVAFAVALRAALPRVDAPPAVSLRERFAGAADRRVQTVLLMTVLGVLGTMSVYIYIVPLLDETAHLTGGVVGVLLLVYGLGAVLGNWLGGRATDRFGSLRTLTVAMVGFAVVVGTLSLTAVTVAGAAIALFVWSLFTWAFNPPIQNLLLELGSGGGLLLALNASAIYLGAGLSAIVGGLVIQLLGVQVLPPIAAVLGLIVLGLVLTLRRNPELQLAEHLKQPEAVAATAD
ncbi:major facilitator superfamily MFS_1 [Kribbella flavida DSM 17836]|uniref:Major facilitator superfamily MFS_1 n=1 Tax=Kribbella flavida (strain DSM 17836 / JCM 10339 / NBRC 14399) TaxID=479435 RepID=D2PRN0_KRIFD|nr:MFS transporter [Kribbella flavida]ADB34948.1 major facilitator superfamily MFS_1 [Kribbella flavida DSM 17836]